MNQIAQLTDDLRRARAGMREAEKALQAIARIARTAQDAAAALAQIEGIASREAGLMRAGREAELAALPPAEMIRRIDDDSETLRK